MKSHAERLRDIIGSNRTARVTTDIEDEVDHYHAYVIGISRKLLVLHVLSDFHLDGYQILRLRDIVKVRIGKFDRIQDRILKRFGVHEKVVKPSWLRFGSWLSVFHSLQQTGKCIAVESALLDVDVFALGTIQRVAKDRLLIRTFDATGKWMSEPKEFFYNEITSVFFDDEYSSTFYDYMSHR